MTKKLILRRLVIALDTLEKISATTRNTLPRRLARSTLRFLENTNPNLTHYQTDYRGRMLLGGKLYTPSEIKSIRLTAKGMSPRQIAEKLGMSQGTAFMNRAKAWVKINGTPGAVDVNVMTQFAIKWGLA